MPIQVIMPQLGESVIEGTVSKWLKAIGEEIKEFEPLLEVITDKVDSEIPSPGDGTLLAILVEEGTIVTAGTTLAWIGDEGETIPDDSDSSPEITPLEETQLTTGRNDKDEPSTDALRPGRNQDLGFISPVVAKISQQESIDLTKVPGTGQGGRITKKDVLNYLEKSKKILGSEITPSTPKIGSVRSPSEIIPREILPHTIVRRSIADHMVKSKQISPHVSTAMEADLNNVVAHRQENKESFSLDGVNLTFTAYFIAAAIAGLKSFPIVNSSWFEDGIQIHKNINFGMATSLGEQGLIVPVIKNADQLSLLGLARTINDLAVRARNRSLEPDEVQGGTFTMTNHGTSGSLFATPIINQPQAAILGVGVIQKRVTVIDDAIAIRPMIYLTLTFDHRILDGAVADHFLLKVVESLQNWK
ncbi:MAG: dihydrolipoamide acetyltransferase family protein [Anaerolineales bacterium]|nr:2-oxo acid dehydrogenase subunit E2 [Anaerolineales bacterium]